MSSPLTYPPDGITDAKEWRWEIAIQAYSDYKLTLNQVAEFVSSTPIEVAMEFRRRNVPMYLDIDDLEVELQSSNRLLAEREASVHHDRH